MMNSYNTVSVESFSRKHILESTKSHRIETTSIVYVSTKAIWKKNQRACSYIVGIFLLWHDCKFLNLNNELIFHWWNWWTIINIMFDKALLVKIIRLLEMYQWIFNSKLFKPPTAPWHAILSMVRFGTIVFCDIKSIGTPSHDDVIKWKHLPRYWPFVRGIHRSPVNSPHKGQWRGALMFSLICAWINGRVNNGETVDLRRHRAHYDVN